MAVTTQLNTGITPLAVIAGGSGIASTVGYSPICGGTTTTGALQSVASVGTSGQFLQSQGAALPQYVTPTELGTSPIKYIKTSISSAQILSMFTTPILLVPAQGANTLFLVNAFWIELIYNSIAYTGGGSVNVVWDNTSSVIALSNAATSITGTSSGTIALSVPAAAFMATTNTINKGLYFTNSTAVFATGNSTANLHLYYSVLSTVI